MTLFPTPILRVDFAKDFTTPPPTSPTTTQAPPMPPRKTTPTTPPTTTRSSTPVATDVRRSSSSQPTPAGQPPATWQNCRPQCVAHQMCPCQAPPSSKLTFAPAPSCDCAQDCPATTSRSNTNPPGSCGQLKSGQADQKSSSKSGITVGRLAQRSHNDC